MRRLTIDVTGQQYKILKAMAALEGKTIKQYAVERLLPGDSEGEQALQELKGLLKACITEGLAGQLANKQIVEIIDDELAKARV